VTKLVLHDQERFKVSKSHLSRIYGCIAISNFMIRDSRMRSMIANEPITPFIYRVNSLHKERGNTITIHLLWFIKPNCVCSNPSERLVSLFFMLILVTRDLNRPPRNQHHRRDWGEWGLV
jgi:Predicted ATPase of the ABC class